MVSIEEILNQETGQAQEFIRQHPDYYSSRSYTIMVFDPQSETSLFFNTPDNELMNKQRRFTGCLSLTSSIDSLDGVDKLGPFSMLQTGPEVTCNLDNPYLHENIEAFIINGMRHRRDPPDPALVLRDFSFLSKLRRLKSLSILNYNYTDDFTPLAGLVDLQDLNMKGTRTLKTLDFLYSMTSLEQLNLNHCGNLAPREFTAFRYAPVNNTLSTLNLAYTGFDNIRDLENCSSLEWVDLKGTKIRTLKGIEHFESVRNGTLNYLDLRYARINWKDSGNWETVQELRDKGIDVKVDTTFHYEDETDYVNVLGQETVDWISSQSEFQNARDLEQRLGEIALGMQKTRISSGFIKEAVFRISDPETGKPQRFVYLMNDDREKALKSGDIYKILNGDLGELTDHTFRVVSHHESEQSKFGLLCVEAVPEYAAPKSIAQLSVMPHVDYMGLLAKFHREISRRANESGVKPPEMYDGTDNIETATVLAAAETRFGKEIASRVQNVIEQVKGYKERYKEVNHNSPTRTKDGYVVAAHGDFKAHLVCPLQDVFYSEEGNIMGPFVIDYDQIFTGGVSYDIAINAATRLMPIESVHKLAEDYLLKAGDLYDGETRKQIKAEMDLAAAVAYSNRMEKFLLSRPNNPATVGIINFYAEQVEKLLSLGENYLLRNLTQSSHLNAA